jgi:hypothetical protein
MNRIRRGILRVLIGTALVALLAAPAFGASATGACKDGKSSGNFATYYSATSDGWNKVDWFQFILRNPNGLGNKSNVSIRHYQNVDNWPDTLKYSWDSNDNIKPNVTYIHSPTSPARTVKGKWAHTRYGFVFDNSGPDDSCHADTDNFR